MTTTQLVFELAPYQPHSATSKAAAFKVTKSAELRARVLKLLSSGPMTDEALIDALAPTRENSTRPARVALMHAGLVAQVGTAKTSANRDAALWAAVAPADA